MNLILGAGLSGLSTSYHLGHENCLILERSQQAFGHISSRLHNGFTWDEGPHVSFTKHEYVRHLFADGVEQQFEEFEAKVGNYYRGNWITHPAQVSLHQVPEPLRSQCVDSFLKTRSISGEESEHPANYQEWLDRAFGPVFAGHFPVIYTRKYWTRDPRDLTTNWVGGRVHSPAVEDVIHGAKAPLGRNAHYITKVRYPSHGGFESFARKVRIGANIQFGINPVAIDLPRKEVLLENGIVQCFDRLISTIPLPEFLGLIQGLPTKIREARDVLCCTELLIVNVTADHPARRPETWLYVYDEDMLSTRINFTEHLSPNNAPGESTGIQVEVYGSRYRPLPGDRKGMELQILGELTRMGLIESIVSVESHVVHVPWANVIFDHDCKAALEVIWRWLEQYGLVREPEDTDPLTNWSQASESHTPIGSLAFAGRFGQWKYFWTDDCVLRAAQMTGKAARPPYV